MYPSVQSVAKSGSRPPISVNSGLSQGSQSTVSHESADPMHQGVFLDKSLPCILIFAEKTQAKTHAAERLFVYSRLPPFLTVPTPTLDLRLGQQLVLLIAVAPYRPKAPPC